MSARRRTSLLIAGIAISLLIITHIFGRTAVTQRIFETEIYAEAFQADRSKYVRISPDAESPPYPYYSTSTWSPFPFVVVANYGVMWGFTGGRGGRRVHLWLLGPVAAFPEYDRWDS